MAPGIAPGVPLIIDLPPPVAPGGAAPTAKLSEASSEAIAIRVDFFMAEVPLVAVNCTLRTASLRRVCSARLDP